MDGYVRIVGNLFLDPDSECMYVMDDDGLLSYLCTAQEYASQLS